MHLSSRNQNVHALMKLSLIFHSLHCIQGPVGRGFQSHTGSFLWSLNSYTKVVHGGRGPYGVDWITEYENGTYLHSAEPRHATIAITETSIQRMKVHYFEYNLFGIF